MNLGEKIAKVDELKSRQEELKKMYEEAKKSGNDEKAKKIDEDIKKVGEEIKSINDAYTQERANRTEDEIVGENVTSLLNRGKAIKNSINEYQNR